MNQLGTHSLPSQTGSRQSYWKSPMGIALLMLGVIAAFYLVREHWGHLAGNWIYLILLLCPLMHLFMHGGHGGHHDGEHGDDDRRDP
jgi:hypothetical protein